MKKTLLIIPGHLGKDTGAVVELDGKTIEERWVNLQQCIGFCIAHESSIYKNLVDVKLVVPNGEVKGGLIDVLNVNKGYFNLIDRANLANEMDADVIEIHNNFASFRAKGAEVLCYSLTDKDGKYSDGALIAEKILTELQKLGIKYRGVKPIYDREKKEYVGRQLYLLRKTKNMALITEAGFMSNPEEIKLLDIDLDAWNEQIGALIWSGYIKHILEVEKIRTVTHKSGKLDPLIDFICSFAKNF